MNVRSLPVFIDATAESALRARRIAGLSVAVAHEDRLLLARGYGYADLERQIRAAADTVYGIGSMTKQFTAVAVMQLVEQGVLGLDDKLGKYLPGGGSLRPPVTIRHLLNHTAGIRGEADLGMLMQGESETVPSTTSILDSLKEELFDSPPGRVWRYSNFGYCVLGILIERVTGDTYANHIRKSVLNRAGLSATWCGASEVPSERLAKGYTDRAGCFATVQMPAMEQTFSSGALYSTVEDLVRWQSALIDGRVIDPEAYQRMTTRGVLETGEDLGYGYGFFLGSCGSHREISHDGTTGGYSSQLAYYPTARLTVAVLTNSESHVAERIEKCITREVLGVPEPTIKKLALSANELTAYTGTYLYKGLQIPVYVESQRLMVRTPGRKLVTLVYQGDHTFGQEDDASVCFEFTVHSEHADGFVVLREGKTLATLRRLG